MASCAVSTQWATPQVKPLRFPSLCCLKQSMTLLKIRLKSRKRFLSWFLTLAATWSHQTKSSNKRLSNKLINLSDLLRTAQLTSFLRLKSLLLNCLLLPISQRNNKLYRMSILKPLRSSLFLIMTSKHLHVLQLRNCWGGVLSEIRRLLLEAKSLKSCSPILARILRNTKVNTMVKLWKRLAKMVHLTHTLLMRAWQKKLRE